MAPPLHLTRDNLGFLLAKAMQRWNDTLAAGFRAHGFSQVRPSFGSILLPLYEQDGLRMGELAARSGLSKQTMTSMVRLVEASGLIARRPDREDGRAMRVFLTAQARRFQPVAETVLSELDAAARATLSADELETVRRWLAAFAAGPPQPKTSNPP